MRLGVARLCLDCDEVHDAERCPRCGSETSAFLTRWVKPEAPAQTTRLTPSIDRAERVDTYRQLLEPERKRSGAGRLVARGVIGVAILGAVRLAWRAGHTLRDDLSPRKVTPPRPAETSRTGRPDVPPE
jgi:hypothetical protein